MINSLGGSRSGLPNSRASATKTASTTRYSEVADSLDRIGPRQPHRFAPNDPRNNHLTSDDRSPIKAAPRVDIRPDGARLTRPITAGYLAQLTQEFSTRTNDSADELEGGNLDITV